MHDIDWELLKKLIDEKGSAHNLKHLSQNDRFEKLFMLHGSSGIRYVSQISDGQHREQLDIFVDDLPTPFAIDFTDGKPVQILFGETVESEPNFTAREHSLLVELLNKIRRACTI